MAEFLMTHSLLSAWLYSMQDNPFSDATTEADPMEDFLKVLRREPRETTEAMQNGIDFENLVTSIVRGRYRQYDDRWDEAARQIAGIVRGGILQLKAKKRITVAGTDLLLFGILDVLKAGTIYEIGRAHV